MHNNQTMLPKLSGCTEVQIVSDNIAFNLLSEIKKKTPPPLLHYRLVSASKLNNSAKNGKTEIFHHLLLEQTSKELQTSSSYVV